MFQTNLFQHTTALVTGGGSGIGQAIAAMLLRLGARVYIASRKQEKLEAAAEELRPLGDFGGYFICDIRNIEQVQAIATGIQEQSGRLDILVNNAGGQFPSLSEDISKNGWDAVINNNLNGTWYMTQTMAKSFFIPQQQGIVLNIIANIYRGFPGMVHTGAARAGVDNLTKTLAVEWSKYNIRVNAVAPGLILSSGMKNYPPELLKGIEDTIPMKRLGTTDEVAWLSLFLCSPMATFITGETVYVDGGQRLWGDVFKL
jgi:citronellol/citronellal dehydrogenase